MQFNKYKKYSAFVHVISNGTSDALESSELGAYATAYGYCSGLEEFDDLIISTLEDLGLVVTDISKYSEMYEEGQERDIQEILDNLSQEQKILFSSFYTYSEAGDDDDDDELVQV
jgi:hypothetical protein